MNRNFSLYLDVMRLAAAILVLLSHFAYPRFSDGDWMIIRKLNLGSDAVVLFFVLSGFVIAFAAERRDRDASTFAFNRATRLYSVVIPAMILTLLCDSIARTAVPGAYDDVFWYGTESIPKQILSVLTFSHEGWGNGVRFGTNGPLWSLGYEAWYYAFFGALFFMKGRSRIAIAAMIAVLAGPRVMLLLPAWWAGVVLWNSLKANKGIPPSIATFMTIVPLVLYLTCLVLSVPQFLKILTIMAIGSDAIVWLRFSDEFVWNALVGLLVAVHFRGVWHLCEQASRDVSKKAERAIRWLAGATFSIYVVHYPVMQMLDVILPETLMMRQAVLLGLVLLACFAFAEFFERRLDLVRRLSVRLIPKFSPAS